MRNLAEVSNPSMVGAIAKSDDPSCIGAGLTSIGGNQSETINLALQSKVSTTPYKAGVRFEDLPKELGVLLASVGVMGLVLPGIAGAPALVAGGLVLWPKTFGKVENWLERRFPLAHGKSMQQVGRFLDDLGRRYPDSPSSDA